MRALRFSPIGALLLALVIGSMCCGASQRTSTLSAALVTLDASTRAFATYDATHQAEIAATAPSLEEGTARLAAYRAKRKKVEVAIAGAYQAIAVASTLNDEPSLAGVSLAAGAVVAAISELMAGAK